MGYTGKKPATSAQIDSSADIVDGVIQSQDIQTLDAAKLTGTVIDARISALTASKLTGTIDNARISLDAAEIPSLDAAKIATGTIADARISASSVTQHVAATLLDSPVITGTLSVADSGTVTHTIANWSEELSYTITPTNCTAGSVNASGQYVITHTSGNPSYTIKATTDSLGLADSALVTKNITMTLSAPTLSSPANVGTSVNVTYTITSTTGDDDKLILNIGSSNFTYQSVSVGTASKVGNTVECVGFTTNNPAVVIQYTAEATYSVTATSVKIDGSFGTSAASSADSITIENFIGTIEYLVVAGAGGGGAAYGGGGAAGGYRTNYGSTMITLTSGNTYTATVGLGGAGANGGAATSGNNSVLSGTGITTITATAGGKGGGFNGGNLAGASGGSGGGGFRGLAGYAGNTGGNGGSPSIPEGHAGGTAYNGGSWACGGGGGAGAVGSNYASSNTGGAGGVGKSNSITASAIYYAGGGGGGVEHNGYGGVGGNGGGGNGGQYSGAAKIGVSGTDGLGGGGGGSAESYPPYGLGRGGDGGNGVVIIRILTADYTGTTSGSPTISTSGSDTIIKFTGNGTYTA